MSAVPLDDFFAAMAEMLDGTASPSQCEQKIGVSPSGTERFGVYAVLVDRQQRSAVESMYRAALVACRSWHAITTESLLREFLAEHPPAHWAPAEVAIPFADYLPTHGAPTDIIELADFAKTRYQVLKTPASDGIEGLAVRYYTHAVKEFTAAVDSGQTSSGRPLATPCTWLFGRHRQHHTLTVIAPSLPLMVALQLIGDGQWSAELPDVEPTVVYSEAAFLASQGLLSDAALAVVRKCT